MGMFVFCRSMDVTMLVVYKYRFWFSHVTNDIIISDGQFSNFKLIKYSRTIGILKPETTSFVY